MGSLRENEKRGGKRMRVISVKFMEEAQGVEPFFCPAGKAKPNCVKCNYREGRVMIAWEEGPTVRCCWEEYMKRKRMESMGVIVDRREDIRFRRFPL